MRETSLFRSGGWGGEEGESGRGAWGGVAPMTACSSGPAGWWGAGAGECRGECGMQCMGDQVVTLVRSRCFIIKRVKLRSKEERFPSGLCFL